MLLATAPSAEGGPAALLPWHDGTLLGRLVDQLAALGVPRAIVLTRPAWEADVRALGLAAEVRASPDAGRRPRGDRRARRRDAEGLVVMYGDMVTHGEALAGLLADPRVVTGVLTGGRARPMVFRIRARRGRLISAGSPYHSVHRPTAAFLGALKVAPGDLATLARVARELAPLAAAPPEAWLQELARKEDSWRVGAVARGRRRRGRRRHRRRRRPGRRGGAREPRSIVLSDEDEARLRHRLAAAPDDAAALLLVGMVRDGAMLSGSHVRKLFWTRPLSARGRRRGRARHRAGRRGPRAARLRRQGRRRLLHHLLRQPVLEVHRALGARRGFTPNQVTTVSVLIGLVAAIAFATGERWGLVTGAVLLQLAFTTDCVDGQLARYTRQFSKLGAWLDSVFDRTKEYLAFAGLAIGASRMGDPVWLLACAAITLQTARHMSDFSFGGSQRDALGDTPQPPVAQALDAAGQAAEARRSGRREARRAGPGAALAAASRVLGGWHRIDRAPGVRWIKKMIAFPIGERFAAISITAALFTPRVTFIVVLVWGGVAAALHPGRPGAPVTAMSAAAVTVCPTALAPPDPIAVYRDDGPLARALGRCSAACGCRAPGCCSSRLLSLIAAIAIGGGDTSRPSRPPWSPGWCCWRARRAARRRARGSAGPRCRCCARPSTSR